MHRMTEYSGWERSEGAYMHTEGIAEMNQAGLGMKGSRRKAAELRVAGLPKATDFTSQKDGSVE